MGELVTYSGGCFWAGRWRAKRRTLCLVICLFQAGDLCQPLRCEREGRLHEILTEGRIGELARTRQELAIPIIGVRAAPMSPQIRAIPSRNCGACWFHVRLGAGSRVVVKERGGCAKSSPRKELGGGIGRSRRDLTIPMVGGQACPSRFLCCA